MKKNILILSGLLFCLTGFGAEPNAGQEMPEKIEKSPEEWRKQLSPEQFHVLRKEGTERPGSSPLTDEKRKGRFVCAGCDLPLFTSEMKYDSGTGWPSFHNALEGSLKTKRDYKMILPRTEYHCARCGGHQGHLFNDGPLPSGNRYCNNGVALRFVPAAEDAGAAAKGVEAAAEPPAGGGEAH